MYRKVTKLTQQQQLFYQILLIAIMGNKTNIQSPFIAIDFQQIMTPCVLHFFINSGRQKIGDNLWRHFHCQVFVIVPF